jgi:hypothetical protein
MEHNIYLTFILASTGLTLIFTWSSIFKPLREAISKKKEKVAKENGYNISFKLLKFIEGIFSCCMCMGFWVGIFLYYPIFKQFTYEILIFGFVSSFCSTLGAAIISYLDFDE